MVLNTKSCNTAYNIEESLKFLTNINNFIKFININYKNNLVCTNNITENNTESINKLINNNIYMLIEKYILKKKYTQSCILYNHELLKCIKLENINVNNFLTNINL